MKSLTIFLVVVGVLLAFLGTSKAVAVFYGDAFGLEDGVELTDFESEGDPRSSDAIILNRSKRATCDLISFLGVNHSACAAHCVLHGRRGGYCNSQAVCVCR